jgi:polyphenol oxidase
MEYDASKLEWLDYDLLSDHPDIAGKTFLRHGGMSKVPFDSLNVSDSVGDHPDAVKVNREKIRGFLQLPQLVFAKQMHGTNLHEVTKENAKKSAEADILFTMEKEIGIGMTHADCQAAIFYDPQHKALAVVHAGWKGLVQNIYKKTVQFFLDRCKTKPENLLVTISPSLGPEHAEFKNYKREFPESLWRYQKEPFHFDLWQMALDQLRESNVQEKNVEVAGICTFCEKKDYFSHRRDKESGRNATVAALLLRK